MTAPASALTPDLVAGLRRLKLARIRAIAPEVCQTAKTQRWAPDELLRTRRLPPAMNPTSAAVSS
jgi:hypothetical protein